MTQPSQPQSSFKPASSNDTSFLVLNGRIYDRLSDEFSVNNLLIEKEKIAGVGYLPDDDAFPAVDLERGFILHNVTDALSGVKFSESNPSKVESKTWVDAPTFRGVSGLSTLTIEDNGFNIPFPHQIISPAQASTTTFDAHLSYFMFPLTNIEDVEIFEATKASCKSQLMGGIDKSHTMSQTSVKTYISKQDIYWILGCNESFSLADAINYWLTYDLGSIEDFCKHSLKAQSLLNIKPTGLGLLQHPNFSAYSKKWEHLLTVHQGKIVFCS